MYTLIRMGGGRRGSTLFRKNIYNSLQVLLELMSVHFI